MPYYIIIWILIIFWKLTIYHYLGSIILKISKDIVQISLKIMQLIYFGWQLYILHGQPLYCGIIHCNIILLLGTVSQVRSNIIGITKIFPKVLNI